MNNTLLFLDVDGVLNTNDWIWTHPDRDDDFIHIDPSRVEIVNNLVSKLDCKVVISSTYRILHSLVDLRYGLREKGATFWNRVIGRTDQIGSMRGDQIERFMFKYPDHKLVILDDSADMNRMMQYLVRTNPDTGIVETDIDRAIAIIDNQ